MTKVVNLKKEPYDIYIGRGSIWGNPYRITPECTREQAISLYRNYILNKPELLSRLSELQGKRLGCFCKPKKCHGDILVDLLLQNRLEFE